MRGLLAAIGLMLTCGAGVAQAQAQAPAANPQLAARVGGVTAEGTERPLHLEKLDVTVRIRGLVAETIIMARFANPGRENIEGEFRFQMPRGSVVTGYALNVGETMIDGVLVEQPRAREAYEDRVRVRVDPGIAQANRADLFSTRVFPILPGAGRTIRLRFVTVIDPREGYRLPLSSDGPVGAVAVAIDAAGIGAAPSIAVPLPLAPRAGGTSFTAINAALSGEVRVRTGEIAPLQLSTHVSGERFFQISGVLPAQGRPAPIDRVRVYWDRSRSRLDDRLGDERALLMRHLAAIGARAIDVVAFNSSGATVRSFTSAAEADRYIGALDYRGGSSFAVLAGLRPAPAGGCLLVSDGIATIGRRDDFRPDCRISAIASAGDADLAWLGQLARAAGGTLVTADPARIEAETAALAGRNASVIAVRDAADGALPFATIPAPDGGFAVVGIAPESGEIVLTIGGAGALIERRYAVTDVAAPRFDGDGALWARDRIAALAGDDARAEEMKAVARAHSVAAPDMAFIVLEQPSDYVNANIAPPGSYPAALRTQYEAMRAAADSQSEARQQARRGEIVAMWQQERSWWTNPPRIAAPERDRRPGSTRMSQPPLEAQMAPPPPPPPPPPPSPAPPPPVMMEESGDMVVTAQRRSGATMSAPMAVTATDSMAAGAPAVEQGGRLRARIEATPWQPDRPYLRALDAAPAAGFAEAFRAQERLHGTLPIFYLDVAGWLWRHERRDEAVEMLMSALDLPVSDDATIEVVAQRLVRYGRYDAAVALYERLALLEAHRPQPGRYLALALEARAGNRTDAAARADLLRAIGLLSHIALTPQDSAFDGIEIISLIEANEIVAKLRRMGVTETGLDPELTGPLDVDVRITLEWNTDNTDMDLWIDEPSGERVIYHHPNSSIGGQLSNDMTQGYGPEQYLLRRAPDGTYRVSANVYASDRLNPNGPTIVTARLFRDYGRATQHEEIVDIELSPEEHGEKLIGRLVVGRSRR